ncbi:MAG: hypothetical protein IJ315_02485, partial [Firmicutes bacterium]|nr:hypothetical protein [Bacillota bacterium]
ISVEVPDDGIVDDLPICEFWGEYNGKLYFVLESYETVGDNVRRTTISIFAWSAAEGMKLVAQVENTR